MLLLRIWQRLKAIAWIFPGFLLWASFPPMAEGADVLFALAPLLWLSRQGDVKRSVRGWAMSGAFYWIATLSWMPAIVKNGGPWPLVLLGWFALAAYCTAYFVAFGWFSAVYWRWARGVGGREHVSAASLLPILIRLLGILLVEPVLWAGFEWLRSTLFGGFAWNPLGLVPANLSFGAPAAVGGVYLLSAVVILVNGTLAGIAERVIASVRRQPSSRWRSLETLAAFGLVFGVYGLTRGVGAEGSAETRGATGDRPHEAMGDRPHEATGDRPHEAMGDRPQSVKVAMVQRNFPCCFQSREENPVQIYRHLVGQVAALKPDLVVLSESAMSEFGPVDQQGAVRFAGFVSRETGGAAVLAGGTRFGDGATYNSAALFTTPNPSAALFTTQDPSAPDAWKNPQVYDKVHLVPFGEYIPGDKIFPALQKLAPVGSCTPGTVKVLRLPLGGGSEQVLEPRAVALGVGICFEDTDAELARAFVREGAEMLVYITNDSWFSHSDEALQHAWQATVRALETGRPVVRVGNSGVTGTVTPQGRATWLLGDDGRPRIDARGVCFDRVMPRRGQTPYVRFGDGPLIALFALVLVFCGVAYHARRY